MKGRNIIARVIPEGSIEIQTGIYLHEYTQTISGTEYTFKELYSSEGYCFYWLSNPENYDEDGNLKPANERVYAQYMHCAISATLETINSDVVSVPIEAGCENVSKPSDEVTE